MDGYGHDNEDHENNDSHHHENDDDDKEVNISICYDRSDTFQFD